VTVHELHATTNGGMTTAAREECEEITVRRTWCLRSAVPGTKRCKVHQDGPFFNPTSDEYKLADAIERDREFAAWWAAS